MLLAVAEVGTAAAVAAPLGRPQRPRPAPGGWTGRSVPVSVLVSVIDHHRPTSGGRDVSWVGVPLLEPDRLSAGPALRFGEFRDRIRDTRTSLTRSDRGCHRWLPHMA